MSGFEPKLPAEVDPDKIMQIANMLPDVLIEALSKEDVSPMTIRTALDFLKQNPISQIPLTGSALNNKQPPFLKEE